jgi:hypothetical protein
LAIGLDPERQLPLLVTFTGLGIALLSIALQRLLQMRQLSSYFTLGVGAEEPSSSMALTGQFLARWQQLELALRSIVGERLGESVANEPLSSLLARLRNERVLSVHDVTILRRLLETRNEVVHKGLSSTDKDFHQSLKDAEQLLAKLSPREAMPRFSS